MSAGVTILLSLTVFHNLVTETLPQVSDAMPVLGTCCEVFIVKLILGITVIAEFPGVLSDDSYIEFIFCLFLINLKIKSFI